MKYILILIIGALIAISCERDLECDTIEIVTEDCYRNNNGILVCDEIIIEIEDCY